MQGRDGKSQHACGLRAQKADLDQTCADKSTQVCSAVPARMLTGEFGVHSSILKHKKGMKACQSEMKGLLILLQDLMGT